MREFRGKVAVVTGAASGIGRAMAERFAAEGMQVVLADVEQGALDKAESELRAAGAKVVAVRTDVSDGASVEALARQTLDAFGAVHLVCNNAGVAGGRGRTWELSVEDWQWVLGVNLWGVIHGVRTFVPIMLAQQSEGHVVNTASLAGLLTGGGGPYTVSKHGVVALSEGLARELEQAGGRVKVSVLCPGFVSTNIADAARNRPARLQNPQEASLTAEQQAMLEAARARLAAGTPPAEIAEHVLNAVRDERFYILPHPEWKPLIQARMEGILAERNPVAMTPPPARPPAL